MTRAIDALFISNTASLQATFGVTVDFSSGLSSAEGIRAFFKSEPIQVVDGHDTTTTGYVDTMQVFLTDVGTNRTGYFLRDGSKYDIVSVLEIDENGECNFYDLPLP